MTRRSIVASGALAVLVLDQAVKLVVDRLMYQGQSISLLPGLLNLTYIRNSGIAFGMFNDGTGGLKKLVLAMTTIAALALLGWILREFPGDDRLGAAIVGMVAGGALGNLVDRLRLGEVIDFVDVFWRGHHWPAFNVADSAISVGVILLVARQLLAERRGG